VQQAAAQQASRVYRANGGISYNYVALNDPSRGIYAQTLDGNEPVPTIHGAMPQEYQFAVDHAVRWTLLHENLVLVKQGTPWAHVCDLFLTHAAREGDHLWVAFAFTERQGDAWRRGFTRLDLGPLLNVSNLTRQHTLQPGTNTWLSKKPIAGLFDTTRNGTPLIEHLFAMGALRFSL
jgi:hypothetical protein